MGKILIDDIKKLRQQTGTGVMDAKKALEASKGNAKKAEEWIRKRGLAKAKKRAGKEASEGLIGSYVHHSGKVAALVELVCETDFVARTDEFKSLAQEIAMQVASMKPKDIKELMGQEYIRDPKKKVGDLVTEGVGKTGEKIEVRRFERMELGSK
jgi:elongation factor Ts